MKRNLVILILLICSTCLGLNAQNLVPNSSFESYSGLPVSYGEWFRCNDWDNVNGYPAFAWPYASPDYLHNSGGVGVNLPNTVFATVSAHEGEAVFGFIAYHGPEPNFREYLSAPLSEPMVPGVTYTISFWITSGESAWYGGAGCNHVGIRFSDGPLIQADHEPIGGTPDLEIPDIYWNTEWELFTFSYTADDTYDRLTIGNFYNDAATDADGFGVAASTTAYYFIDEVSVIPATITTIIDTTICDGTFYTLPDGTTTAIGGTYTQTLITDDGADSIVITNLFIAPIYNLIYDAIICEGGVYILPDGEIVTAAGTYVTSLLTASGCDSIITTNLEVLPFYITLVDTAICSGEMYILPDGITITAAGIYNTTLISAAGCDSIITTNLSLITIPETIVDVTICSGASYTLPDGVVVDVAGTYSTILSAVSGCDSLITTHLNLIAAFESFITADICEGESYTLPDGSTTTSSGNFTTNLIAVGGCDSVVYTTVNVHPLPIPVFDIQPFICLEAEPILLNATPGGGIFSGLGVEDNTFNPATSGVGGPFEINYFVTDVFGCSAETIATIEVYQNFADAGTDVTINAGESTLLSGNSGGDYNWSPELFADCANCQNTLVTPFETTSFVLYSMDVNGCVAFDTVDVIVIGEIDVIIPNAFSPNQDGINDIYHVLLYGAELNNFSIYDRWGKLVYVNSGNDVSWDGTMQGKLLEMGVYVYAAEYILHDVIITKSGTITLLR